MTQSNRFSAAIRLIPFLVGGVFLFFGPLVLLVSYQLFAHTDNPVASSAQTGVLHCDETVNLAVAGRACFAHRQISGVRNSPKNRFKQLSTETLGSPNVELKIDGEMVAATLPPRSKNNWNRCRNVFKTVTDVATVGLFVPTKKNYPKFDIREWPLRAGQTLTVDFAEDGQNVKTVWCGTREKIAEGQTAKSGLTLFLFIGLGLFFVVVGILFIAFGLLITLRPNHTKPQSVSTET